MFLRRNLSCRSAARPRGVTESAHPGARPKGAGPILPGCRLGARASPHAAVGVGGCVPRRDGRRRFVSPTGSTRAAARLTGVTCLAHPGVRPRSPTCLAANERGCWLPLAACRGFWWGGCAGRPPEASGGLGFGLPRSLSVSEQGFPTSGHPASGPELARRLFASVTHRQALCDTEAPSSPAVATPFFCHWPSITNYNATTRTASFEF